MLLFFDTETTGLPDFKAPSDHPSQPHLVQLAALLTEDNGENIASISAVIAPHGYDAMPEPAFKSHGISFSDAQRKGVLLTDAVSLFIQFLNKAKTRIAHNVSFDDKLMKIASCRAGSSERMRAIIDAQPTYCTLKNSTPIVNLPPTEKMVAAGFNRPKSPQLGESYKYFFNEPLMCAHDALVDVKACKRIYFAMTSSNDRAQ